MPKAKDGCLLTLKMIGRKFFKPARLLSSGLLLLCLCASMTSTGQGSHYWTRNYGARSTLLSNSVIGSVNDLGAVFYNPGRIGLIEDPTFILSADVYEFSNVQFKDLPGDRVSLSSSDIGSVPGFVAGTFRFKKLPGHTFAYSALTRQRNDVNIRYREEIDGDLIPELPGIESISSTTTLNEVLRQQWYSLSWAFSPGEDWGFGATMAGVRYKSERLSGLDFRVYTQSDDLGTYQFDRFFNFSNYGLLFKFGLAKRNPKINWGVTVTTPFIRMFGSGDVDFVETLEPLDESERNYFAAFQQGDLEAKYKLPWSIGGGLSYRIPKGEVYFSSEWFAPVAKYSIMESDEFIGQSEGDTLQMTVVDDLNSIINFGIGAHYQASERLGVYLSASTDFSAVDEDISDSEESLEVSNSTFTTNLYHIASGVVFDIANSDITLGLTYTGATQPIDRIEGLPGQDPVFDPGSQIKYQWTRLQVVLGFSLSFVKN